MTSLWSAHPDRVFHPHNWATQRAICETQANGLAFALQEIDPGVRKLSAQSCMQRQAARAPEFRHVRLWKMGTTARSRRPGSGVRWILSHSCPGSPNNNAELTAKCSTALVNSLPASSCRQVLGRTVYHKRLSSTFHSVLAPCPCPLNPKLRSMCLGNCHWLPDHHGPRSPKAELLSSSAFQAVS